LRQGTAQWLRPELRVTGKASESEGRAPIRHCKAAHHGLTTAAGGQALLSFRPIPRQRADEQPNGTLVSVFGYPLGGLASRAAGKLSLQQELLFEQPHSY